MEEKIRERIKYAQIRLKRIIQELNNLDVNDVNFHLLAKHYQSEALKERAKLDELYFLLGEYYIEDE